MSSSAACLHGGASFHAIGEDFDDLERSREVISADVLDAWFPPAPGVVSALEGNLTFLLRTSPPTTCAGMIRAIARARGVPAECILPGAGSSELIFLAFREWLKPESQVLLLDPTYGEYAHVTQSLIGCKVHRQPLSRAEQYRANLSLLKDLIASSSYDLIVIVNPNSPTGQHIPRTQLEKFLAEVPSRTRVWLDETYIDYVGPDESLERVAAQSENIIICKSMSKVYALSGVRAAYLCAPPRITNHLREISPPWAVSLPAQVAAVKALEDPDYYAARYCETHCLGEKLAASLHEIGLQVIPSVTNFLLCHLPEGSKDAASVARLCRERHVYVRDAGEISALLGKRAFRIAIKEEDTNKRMLEVLRWALS